MFLNKNDLLELGKLKTEEVDFNGNKVLVSEISAADYQKIWQECVIDDGVDDKGAAKQTVNMSKFNNLLLVYCLVDENGARIFGDADASCFDRYAQAPFSKMVAAAKRINGLMGEEAKKDSEPTNSDLPTGE